MTIARAARTFLIVVLALGLAIVMSLTSAASADPVTAPSATTTTTMVVATPTSESSPGLFDISGHVRQAINDWITSLVTSAINPALDLLGHTLLSAPNLTDQAGVHAAWMISLGVADTTFVLFGLIGGIVVMTHETVQTRYSAKEIAPRLVLAIIAANASLLIVSQSIALANGLAQGFLGDGVDPNQAVGGIGRAVVANAGAGGFLVLLAAFATALALVLVCLYLARAVLVVLLIAAAPVALACHALPQTERVASLWWRSMTACLGIQVAQALVLVTAVRVFFAPDSSNVLGFSASDGLVSLLIVVCLMWIMLRIPRWAERLVFGSGGGPVKAVTQRVVTVAKAAAVTA